MTDVDQKDESTNYSETTDSVFKTSNTVCSKIKLLDEFIVTM